MKIYLFDKIRIKSMQNILTNVRNINFDQFVSVFSFRRQHISHNNHKISFILHQNFRDTIFSLKNKVITLFVILFKNALRILLKRRGGGGGQLEITHFDIL